MIFFEKIFRLLSGRSKIFARIREEKKKRGEKKSMLAMNFFVFTLRTDHFSVPLSIVGLIISPLFTRNYSLVAKRIENQFCNARWTVHRLIDKTHFFPFHSDDKFRLTRQSKWKFLESDLRIFLTIQFEFRRVIHPSFRHSWGTRIPPMIL